MGSSGIILTSPNGVDWTTRDSGTTDDLTAVSSNGGKHIVVTWTRKIMYAEEYELDDWTVVYTQNFGSLSSPFVEATWGGGKFIATSLVGFIFYSKDGINWERGSSGPTLGSGFFYKITYGMGQFVGVGVYGRRITSPDGITWTERSSGERFFRDVTSDGTVFVAVTTHGLKYISYDGLNWKISNYSYIPARSITWVGGQFVIVGDDGGISRSQDGINWTTGENIGVDKKLNAIAWNGVVYVVVVIQINCSKICGICGGISEQVSPLDKE